MDSLIAGTVQEHKQLFEKKEVLDNLLYKAGFSCHTKTSTKFKLYRCISDNKESVTILPDGEIGLCEHYSENHFVADIKSSTPFNTSEVSFLRKRLPKLDICSNCSYYPFCIRLECCPDCQNCFYELKKQNIRNLHRELLAEFDTYLKNNS